MFSHSKALTIDQWHAGTVWSTLTDAFQIPIQKFSATNFETFLNNLRCILVHTVLGSEAKNVIDSATTVRSSTMLADMLNAPVPELTMCDDIDARQNFVDTRALCKPSV